MIKLNVLNLLQQKGKTRYWLWKQFKMSYQNFNKMLNNETRSIRYENIQTLCAVLECKISDLFIVVDDSDDQA